MRGLRAAAAAALMVARLGRMQAPRPPLKTAIPRLSDITAVRRYGVGAMTAALVASLWAEETAGQCLFAAAYGPAADFGRVTRLIPRAAQPVNAAGARALWDRMQAAGYSFSDDPIAVDRLARPATAAVAVRMLNPPPGRRRAETRKVA
ncbi:MAG: hypothetical protein NW203_00995 [Hyphomonadaceae bacterium]|nr:hypothetical protein [Hyphomonadaceae bacterium]